MLLEAIRNAFDAPESSSKRHHSNISEYNINNISLGEKKDVWNHRQFEADELAL
jgi:hypothetical protein